MAGQWLFGLACQGLAKVNVGLGWGGDEHTPLVATVLRAAKGVAHLRMGWFKPVHCKSVCSWEMRALLGTRNTGVEGLKLGKVSKGGWEDRVRELTAARGCAQMRF